MKSWISILLAMAALVGPSYSDIILVTEGGTGSSNGGWKTVGFSFTVDQTISVTQLGFYGEALGGGDTPNVYLQDVTGNSTLTSASWAALEAGNGWNYKAITPVSLVPGNTYQVSTPLYWTQTYPDASGFSYGADITPVAFYLDANSGGWTDGHITTTPTTTPYIGANLQYTVAAIPEPSALLLSALGLGALILRRRWC